MNKNIIENISFDTKVTDKFYVIKDTDKIEKNSTFIKNNFDLISLEEGYYYGYMHLEFEKNIYLSFTNEYGFILDFVILKGDTTKNIEVIKFLSENVEDEIRSTTIDIYEDSIDY